jgi:hypothetical protein
MSDTPLADGGTKLSFMATILPKIKEYIQSTYDNAKRTINENTTDIAKHRFDIVISDPAQQSNIAKQLKKTGIFLGFLLFSFFFILYAASDPAALTGKTYIYTIIIILPVLLGLYASTQFTNEGEGGALTKIIMLSIALLLFAAFAYVYSSASSSTITLLNYFLYAIFILMVLVGMALFYFVFSNYLKKQTGTLGYMINLIFYIPCLFGDFVKYMKNQIGITPNVSYVLFVMEIILILMYFYVPILMRTLITKNSNLLLNDPIFLNNEMTVASGEFFQLKPHEELANNSSGTLFSRSIANPTYRNSNYAVSFWVFINPGGSNDERYNTPHNIFNYSSDPTYAVGKPSVRFQNDGHTHKSKYIVTFTDNSGATVKPYELTLPHQKWHYFAFNYFSGKADLFVNGNLERTFVFEGEFNVPTNGAPSDNITVGQIGGLNGAICNVNYYTELLSKTQIANYYNILMNNNPPITISTSNGDDYTTNSARKTTMASNIDDDSYSPTIWKETVAMLLPKNKENS